MNSYSDGSGYFNLMITYCVIDVEQKPDTSPFSQFYVTSCTHLIFDPSEVKNFQNLIIAPWMVS